jgi:hypothetical protein
MWTYLLIVLVIALALAPLAHFVPSKRQRKLARMREYAALHGLFVEFRQAPTVAGETCATGQEIYYGKRIPAKHAAQIESAAWVRTAEGWRCVSGRVPPPPSVAELPTDIRAASIDQASCGVYWTESADVESVEQIRQALERWSEPLAR